MITVFRTLKTIHKVSHYFLDVSSSVKIYVLILSYKWNLLVILWRTAFSFLINKCYDDNSSIIGTLAFCQWSFGAVTSAVFFNSLILIIIIVLYVYLGIPEVVKCSEAINRFGDHEPILLLISVSFLFVMPFKVMFLWGGEGFVFSGRW